MLFATLALVATATWSSPALAQATRCEFAVSLSGGGARGAAHLGVLEVLEENGIRPDCIVGTSMGAIIGAMYAAGHTTDQIAVVLRSISLRNLYTEPFRRATQPLLHRLEQRRTAIRFGIDGNGVHLPRSILSDALVNRLFVENLAPAGFVAGRRFDLLAIPFRTVATNLNTGQRVPLVEGDLARAVRASMSVPLAYAPIVWGDTLLADGGLVDNNPVSLARELGATYVVAVDASTPVEAEFYPDLIGVTSRIIDLLYDTKNRQHAVEPELWIRPNLEGHSFADYAGIDTVIRLGREATEAHLKQIPERFHGRPINRSPAPGPEVFDGLPIHDVRVLGNTGLAASFIIAETRLRVGDTFDFAHALEAVDHLYATGLMSGVWVDVEPDGDGVRVSLSVVEQTRQTLDIGLAYQSDDQAQAFLRLETRDLFGNGERAQFSAVASTRERRFNLRLHGARLFDAHIGYQLDLTLDKEKPKVYRDAMFVTRAKFVRRSAQLGVNLPFAVDALAQVGVRFGRAEIESQLGLEEQIETSRKHGVLYARLIWDDLTSLTHPIGGKRLSVLVERDNRALGADAGYWRIQVDGRGALPLTRTLVLDTRFVFGASSGDLPIYEQFRIGGPALVPGLARDELWGNQATAGSMAIAYDFGSVFRAYGRGGAGMVMERLEDIDFGELVYGVGVGLTVATPIGPLQFDYGWSEDQRNRLYVALGWQ